MGHFLSCARLNKTGGRRIRKFTYRELSIACNEFRSENIIGRGDSGIVYRGKLPRGQFIAAKLLHQYRREVDREYEVEVNMLSRLRHQNLIRLVGYCSERNHRIVVYEFMPLGSLETLLHDDSIHELMDWETRVKIAADMSRGLNFLHNQTDPRVMYRNVKSSHVLLGEGFHAKLSDLGQASSGLVEAERSTSISASTDAASRKRRLQEKKGYGAPEYAATGTYTVKSEVYSFGVLLLELFSGTKPIDQMQGDGTHTLLPFARIGLDNRQQLLNLADLRWTNKDHIPQNSLRRAFEVILMCLEHDPNSRPDMAYVMDAFDRLVEEGQTRSSRVFEVGQTSGSQVLEEGQASGSQVLEVGEASGSQVLEVGQASGSRVVEVGEASCSQVLEEEEEEEEEGGGGGGGETPREETEQQLQRT